MKLAEICSLLHKSKTTVYYWIKDINIIVSRKPNNIAASKVLHEKYKKLRELAYTEGLEIYLVEKNNNLFRDFLVIYLTEGHRKSKNTVSIVNTNPKILKAVKPFMEKFTNNKIWYSLQVYPDTNIDKTVQYWKQYLKINDEHIRILYKSNAGNLKGRNSSVKYGIMTIGTNDTYFREKLRAWTDIVQLEWENKS